MRVTTGPDYHNRVPGIKRLAARLLTLPALLPAIERTTGGTAAVLTLHRFSAFGRPGHDPDRLARDLEWLRRRRYRMVSILDLVRDARAGRAPEARTVAFTVDDGYADFAEVAAPVFARYDCPVTVFLISGFLDGGLWMWWDRVRFATEATRLTRGAVTIGATTLDFELGGPGARRGFGRDIIAHLKLLPDPERERAQRDLEARLEVALPECPPLEFGPLSWDQARALERNGVGFGPHSVSHPILARTDDARARREVTASWARLREMLERPAPVFCWPNGDATSFGPREEGLAREIGMEAALSTIPGPLTPAWFRRGREYALPRFAYPADPTDFVQVVSGLERLKHLVRRGSRSGWS